MIALGLHFSVMATVGRDLRGRHHLLIWNDRVRGRRAMNRPRDRRERSQALACARHLVVRERWIEQEGGRLRALLNGLGASRRRTTVFDVATRRPG